LATPAYVDGVKGHTPASTPSQREAEPVIVEQNAAQVEAVTPLKVNKPVTSRLVEVAFVAVNEPNAFSPLHVLEFARSVVEATVIFAVPSNDTPFMVRAVSSAVAVDAFPTSAPFTVVNHAVVPDNNVVVALLNVFNPVHVFTLARSVDDAAVTVIAVPGTTLVPLIVPKDVVEKTRPLPSVARSALARLLICKLVVVAFTASVEEAMSCVVGRYKGVVVL